MKIVAHIKRYRTDIPSILENFPPMFKAGDVKEIFGEFVTICCPEMERAIKIGMIKFGESYPYLHNQNKTLNIAKHITDLMDPKRENEVAIQFCPFCSEKIEIIDNELNQVGDALIK